jgi:hypothetical protein
MEDHDKVKDDVLTHLSDQLVAIVVRLQKLGT